MVNIPKYYRSPVIRNVLLCIVRLFENTKFYTQESKNVDNSIPFVNYTDSLGTVKEKIIPVPIHLGFYDKAWANDVMRQSLEKNGKVLQQFTRPIPSICVTMDGLSYDGTRHSSANVKRLFYECDSGKPVIDPTIDSYFSDVMPVPYNLQISIELQARSFDQICQFCEQVLPYFQPQRSIRIKEFNFLNLERDLKCILVGTSPDLMKDVQLNEEKRTYSITLNLEVQAFFYHVFSPIKIIKKINSNYLVKNIEENKENNFFEKFSTKFISPKFTYDEITGNFIIEKDEDGNVIYEEPRIENNESLLQFYNERLIENSDVFVYSGASGNSGFEGSLVKPLQVFVK